MNILSANSPVSEYNIDGHEVTTYYLDEYTEEHRGLCPILLGIDKLETLADPIAIIITPTIQYYPQKGGA